MTNPCRRLRQLTAAVICLSFWACNSAPEIAGLGGTAGSSDKSASKKRSQGNLADEENSADGVLDPGGPDPQSETNEKVDYPEFKFAGDGQTSNNSRNFPTTSQIMTTVSATEFQVNQTAARVIVSSNSGAQRDADNDINNNSLGITKYVRPSREELVKFVDADGKSRQAPYVVFAKAFTNNRGKHWTFSDPLPVFPWPGKMSRYSSLDVKPGSWTARATGPDGSFDVTINVSKASTQGDTVTLLFETIIPTDSQGEQYEMLPFPKEARYDIDTVNQRISGISSVYWFFADSSQHSSRKREQTTITYRLCNVRKAGVETSVNSCP